MDFQVETLREWFTRNVQLADALSPIALRNLTTHILLGQNYRFITEQNTKSKLAFTNLWISDVVELAQEHYGVDWKQRMLSELLAKRNKSQEEQYLEYWLVGLTKKTLVNLSGTTSELPTFLTELETQLRNTLSTINRVDDLDKAWLLMMAGSSTLSIRGADKSTIGKALEKTVLRTILVLLGFQENVNFWVNLNRDNEVERETDAEVQTRRSRVRVEMGLIAQGNQEVVEDKVNRVGQNGIVIFDKVGANTRIYDTAARHHVKLVQIRNNQPLLDVYRHLQPLVDFTLNQPPQTETDIHTAVNALPGTIFGE